jgi:hypothetical protein
MTTTVKIKRSETASSVPSASDLQVGELAVNLEDQKMYSKKSDGTVVQVAEGNAPDSGFSIAMAIALG